MTKKGKYYAEYLAKINTDSLNPVDKYHFYYYLYLLDSGNPKWKEILRKLAPDVLEAIGEHVFESPVAIAWQGEEYTEKN